MTFQPATVAVLVLLLFLWARGVEAALPLALPTPPQPFDLASTARILIHAAALPSGFAPVAKRGAVVRRLFEVPTFPGQYKIYRAVSAQPEVRFYVGGIGATDEFAIVSTAGSTLAHQGYQSPIDWLATVEQLIAPDLGASYTKKILHNGAIFFSRGKPTIEFFFVEGIPAESATQRSYNMDMLVFRPHATVLELIDPCQWWTTTPPPNWSAAAQRGGCTRHWVEVNLHP